MIDKFRNSLVAVIVTMTFLTGQIYADNFEFLTYAPPSGWTMQTAPDKTAYLRPNGVGLITFYPSYAATGSAAEEFAKLWRTRVSPVAGAQPPQPQIERDGEYTAAIGAQRVDAQGTITTISLVAFVGRGRALGVLTLTAGDDALREVSTFFDTLKVTPGVSSPTSPNASASASPNTIEVDYDLPAGYASQRDGGIVVLKPTALDRNTPCVYGISPARPSSGKLDADAASAILEPLPGWQIKSEYYNAMQGVSGAGWPYYWFRTDVQRLAGGSYQYLTAMSMAFPTGDGRVNIVWGFGSTGVCLADDNSFLRLFYSLRPRGWTSDGGKALAGQLLGTWRDTQAAGMAQYKFYADGRYEYGLGTSTTFGNLETRTGSASVGRYELRGSELTLNPDNRSRGVSKFRLRIYNHYNKGGWIRAMSLFNENASPAREVEYAKVDQ